MSWQDDYETRRQVLARYSIEELESQLKDFPARLRELKRELDEEQRDVEQELYERRTIKAIADNVFLANVYGIWRVVHDIDFEREKVLTLEGWHNYSQTKTCNSLKAAQDFMNKENKEAATSPTASV